MCKLILLKTEPLNYSLQPFCHTFAIKIRYCSFRHLQIPNFPNSLSPAYLRLLYQQMQSLRSQFQVIHQKFRQYKKSHQIPNRIYLKLSLLASCILKSHLQQDLSCLQPEQISSLQSIELVNQITLFNSIAGCLIGLHAPTQVKEAFIKKDSMFASWQACYLSYDHENLYITRRKKKVVPLKDIRTSTIVRNKSSKFTFTMEIGGKRYYLGFANQEVARKMLQGINQRKKQGREEQVSFISSQIDEAQAPEPIPSLQSPSEPALLSQFDLTSLQSDESFRIFEAVPTGRILIHTSNPLTCKLTMLIHSGPQILDLLCDSTQWNPQVQQTRIVSKLDQNVYILYEKLKQYDGRSRQRDFLFIRAAVKKHGRIYMVDKSIESAEFPEGRAVVRGCIMERSFAVIPAETDPLSLLCIVRLTVDFRGMNNDSDNRNMAVKMLKGYSSFRSYCHQKHLYQTNNTQLFNFKKTQIRLKQVPIRNSYSLPLPVIKQPPVQPQLPDLMPPSQSTPMTPTYLSLIQQNHHLWYYLRHTYTLCVSANPGPLHPILPPGDFIFQNGDWMISPAGQFIFLNKKVISAQKDVIRWIVSQVCTNLIKGKSIMHMSLPVDIFDDRGLLQRSAGGFGFAPIFLSRAGMQEDHLEQIKLVTIFLITLPLLELRAEKPFNPILGETFQGSLGGIPVYYQQISHHPPISAYYMKCDQFELFGNLVSYAQMGVNSGVGGNSGIINIRFPKTQTHFECSVPPCELSGLVVGERRFKVINRGFVIQRNKLLWSQVSFGKDKKHVYPHTEKLNYSQISGGIFRINEQFVEKYSSAKLKYKFQGLTHKDMFQKISEISGAWNDTILFDDVVYKKQFDPAPYVLQYQLFQLPSSSNFRQDLILKRLKDLAESQLAKQKLQHLQREDRRLRSQH